MKPMGMFLVILGILILAAAGLHAPQAPNVSYLMGTFLPGLFCLIIGLKLAQIKKPKPESSADDDEPDATHDHRGR